MADLQRVDHHRVPLQTFAELELLLAAQAELHSLIQAAIFRVQLNQLHVDVDIKRAHG